MSNLPGNPFAEGPDNYRETLHELGKSHLAYEISAALALAYEQRTANLIALLDTPAGRLTIMREGDHAMDAVQGEIRDRLGMRAEK